jgi:2-phospho-L-lactate guanylyltransferase
VHTVVVLPVKRFAAAKQRLGREDRATLMEAMAGRVLAALAGADVARTVVVTDDPAAERLAAEHGAEVLAEGGELGHSAAAALGVAHARAGGAARVLLLAGDCPLVAAADVDALLERHGGEGVVVLADRHGTGTNGLLLSPPGAIAPAFGPGSRIRHERLAAEAGLPCVVEHVPAFALDVDTVDDLALVEQLRAR